MTGPVEYLHLQPGAAPPDMDRRAPYRAVIVVDTDVSAEWRADVSTWLVSTGCLYMCAWGRECSAWDDSVDWANLAEFEFGDIPDDRFVMTTWHARESLADAMFFARSCALHPTVDLEITILIHITDEPDPHRLLDAFAAA